MLTVLRYETQPSATDPRHLYAAAMQYWRTCHRLTDQQAQEALKAFVAGASLVEAAVAARAAA